MSKTYAQQFAEELGSLIDASKAMLDEVEGLGNDMPFALKSAWGTLHTALVPFGVVEPIPDAHGPHGGPESACKGFQWIGQSREHCNGCGDAMGCLERYRANANAFEDFLSRIADIEGRESQDGPGEPIDLKDALSRLDQIRDVIKEFDDYDR